jgi:hypothetical protein
MHIVAGPNNRIIQILVVLHMHNLRGFHTQSGKKLIAQHGVARHSTQASFGVPWLSVWVSGLQGIGIRRRSAGVQGFLDPVPGQTQVALAQQSGAVNGAKISAGRPTAGAAAGAARCQTMLASEASTPLKTARYRYPAPDAPLLAGL